MSDKQNDKGKNQNKPKLPKNPFNFYWIYGIIAVALIALQYSSFGGGPVQEMDQAKFFNSAIKKTPCGKGGCDQQRGS